MTKESKQPTVARARSTVYGLLAAGFSYPERALFRDLAEGRFAAEMVSALSACGLPAPDAEMVSALRPTMSFEEFEAAYLCAFETDAPMPSISLYQSSYVPGIAKSELLLELKAFYENFGLAVAPELHELEDKLTAELEIMHFLAGKQALAEDDSTLRVGPYVLAQRDFLAHHLAEWLPRFGEAVAVRDAPPLFRGLATLAATFVVRDTEAMEQAARRFVA